MSKTLIFLTLSSLIVACSACPDNGTTGFKGIFVFGDDIVDPGNNNKLFTFFMKANFLPYGLDFPNGASGRWSNGKTVIDCIADKLGLPYPSPWPYDDTSAQNAINIVQGVNFGSTGTGLFRITGMGTIGKIKKMPEQLTNFREKVVPDLKKILNCRGQTILPQYLFVVGTGNNDYSSWWILKQYLVVNHHVMAAMMVNHMSNYLQELYKLGARKFLLIAAYPIGCNPGIVGEKTDCAQKLNNATDIYHQQLLTMVEHDRQLDMPDAEFTVLNARQILLDIYKKKTNSGISVVDCPCCQLQFGDICKKAGSTCLNRNQYLYFDGYHLTEAANCFLGHHAVKGNNKLYVAPANVDKVKSTPYVPLDRPAPPLIPRPWDEPPVPKKN